MALMLKGLKVLDFTNNIAGPTTSALMADHGAEVIKIEKPVLGDDVRAFAPVVDGTSIPHFYNNRSKKSVVLDLKDPRAVDVVKQLVKEVDVLVEASRPGAMEKLGLGYETLKQIKPDIVYCSISGFGQKGPYRNRAGYDVIAQAFSGCMYYTGNGDGRPTKVATPIGDMTAALCAYGSIMEALFYRQLSGKGQHIDVNLARAATWLGSDFSFLITGKDRERGGMHDCTLCPYGIFEGSGGEHLVIATVSAKLWAALCTVLGKPEFADDPRYCSHTARIEHRPEVIDMIETWLKSFDKIEDAAAILDAAGIPNCKVNSFKDIYNDPHVQENEWLAYIPSPHSVTSVDHCRSVAEFAVFSEGENTFGPAPDLGEHNYEILSRCGLSHEEIDAMESEWRDKVLGGKAGK